MCACVQTTWQMAHKHQAASVPGLFHSFTVYNGIITNYFTFHLIKFCQHLAQVVTGGDGAERARWKPGSADFIAAPHFILVRENQQVNGLVYTGHHHRSTIYKRTICPFVQPEHTFVHHFSFVSMHQVIQNK